MGKTVKFKIAGTKRLNVGQGEYYREFIVDNVDEVFEATEEEFNTHLKHIDYIKKFTKPKAVKK